jgi:chemotaxis protein methyltransferase CheR
MPVIAKQAEEREFAFSDREFKFLAELVNGRTGIVIGNHKKDMVYSRLVRRLRALKMGSFAEYCDFLQGPDGDSEIGNLVNAITTNLTSFFREKHHFDHLHDEVLMPLLKTPPPQKRLRIWSAACSSGMEPYSIAMTVRGAIKDCKSWDARILATDIDTEMLKTGAAGVYSSENAKNIPENFMRGIDVNAEEETITMCDDLKELIAFKQLNLLESWPMKGLFDVVFCRNVVIYFDKSTQTKLFARMAEMIKPHGWLYIGHSENLHNISDRFQLLGRTIYRKVR